MADPAPLPLVDALLPLLRTRRTGRAVRGYTRVGSTNTEAAAWAAAGAPDGAVVVAEYQASGRGRLGRTWTAPPGVNLTVSVVLRPGLALDRLGLLPLAAAVAVAEAAAPFVAPADVAIKWPNDVLVDGRKVCGILVETATAGDRAATAVVGIGLNVNQTDFPPEHADRATSLALAAGRPLPRAAVLADLLAAFEAWDDALRAGDDEALRSRYASLLAGRGEPLALRQTDTGDVVEGVLYDVTATGALRLRTADGLRTFHAGDVTTRTL